MHVSASWGPMARRAGADAIGKYARFVAKTWSVVGYFGMVAGLLGLLATRQLFSSSPLVIGIQVLAAILFLWARMTFGLRSFHLAANPTEGGLVRSGPYRMIRHPIYSAMCLIAAAGAAGNWSWESGLCV